MVNEIRIAPGNVTAYELLSNDNYLVSEWARTSDMSASIYWSAAQPELPLLREEVAGIGIGTGQFYGGYSGTFNIFMATPLMRQYLFETIMQSKPIAPVTVYMQASQGGFEQTEFQVLYGEMQRMEFTRFDDTYYHTLQYEFRRGVVRTVSNLLLETGDYLLLEDGNRLSLESQ